MVNGIKTGNPHGFNKGCSSKFHESSRVRQTPEDRRTYRPKHCGNNNEDEDNSPKTLNDKNITNMILQSLKSFAIKRYKNRSNQNKNSQHHYKNWIEWWKSIKYLIIKNVLNSQSLLTNYIVILVCLILSKIFNWILHLPMTISISMIY